MALSAYDLYTDPSSEESTETGVGSLQEMSMAERFKRAFSYKGVRVHFVGAWYVTPALTFSILLI
jgi:hypothetical protein